MIGSIFEHAIASIAKASIGAIVYASDDQTLTLVSTANNFVGWVVQVQDTGRRPINQRVTPADGLAQNDHAQYFGVASVRFQKSQKRPDQSGLSRAIWSQKPNSAAFDAQRNIVQG